MFDTPCVVILCTLYIETYFIGLFNSTITSLFLFAYVCDIISTFTFSIFICFIFSADGLFTINFTFTVLLPCSSTSVDNISAKSLSATSGNSIYSCFGITSDIITCG